MSGLDGVAVGEGDCNGIWIWLYVACGCSGGDKVTGGTRITDRGVWCGG